MRQRKEVDACEVAVAAYGGRCMWGSDGATRGWWLMGADACRVVMAARRGSGMWGSGGGAWRQRLVGWQRRIRMVGPAGVSPMGMWPAMVLPGHGVAGRMCGWWPAPDRIFFYFVYFWERLSLPVLNCW